MITPLQTAINAYLRLDPETLKRLGQLDGKVIAVELTGWGLKLYCFPHAEGMRLERSYNGEPDAYLCGSPLAMFSAGMKRGQSAAMAQGIEVEGDTELGHEIAKILQAIDIDWEEHLSHWTGDVAAHQIGNVWRKFNAWRKQTSKSMTANLTEFLQEETRHLPPREEVEDFFADVAKIRNDVERLEAHFNKEVKDV